jgi:hypothetical protein
VKTLPTAILLAGVVLVTLPLSAQMTPGTDNFDDNTLGTIGAGEFWVLQQFNGTGAALTNQNGRLEFTASTPTGYNASTLFRTRESVNAGSYSSDWTVTVRATNLVNSATLNSGGFAQIGLTVTTRFDSDSNGSPNSFNGQYSLLLGVDPSGLKLATNSGRWNTGTSSFNYVALASPFGDPTDVLLRLAWNAGAQDLLAQYSTDGGTTFLTDRVFDLNGVDVGLGAPWNNAFALYVVGHTSALGSTPVTSGQMHLDDFTVTAIPEPSTYAVLAGLGALGLAVSRQRKLRKAG